jgi:uncharacterized membrane protein YuzA (DUF378 family)
LDFKLIIMEKLDKFFSKVGIDKVCHFLAGILVCFMVALLFAKVNSGYSDVTYAATGLCGAVLVGIAKEGLDFFDSHEDCAFSFTDLFATVIGGALGFLMIWGLL